MRIYVACLASYNNERLHGAWIDASEDVGAMGKEVAAMLRASTFPNVTRQEYRCDDCDESRLVTLSDIGEELEQECPECGDAMLPVGGPFPSAEEWAIHDSEGLGDLGEYASLQEITKRATLADVAEDRGIPLSVILAYADDYCASDADADDIGEAARDAFCREAATWRDFVQDMIEETHDLSEVPEWLKGHIDWDSLTRDWKLGGDFDSYRDGGTLYVFYAH